MSAHESLESLAARRWRIAVVLTSAMTIVYLAFILLVAYNKPLLGTVLVPGLSLGIALGALTIVAAWLLIVVYVWWANRHYDDAIAALKRSAGTPT